MEDYRFKTEVKEMLYLILSIEFLEISKVCSYIFLGLLVLQLFCSTPKIILDLIEKLKRK